MRDNLNIMLRSQNEAPTKMFYCEFFETFKNTFFIEHLQQLLLFRAINNLNEEISEMNLQLCASFTTCFQRNFDKL